MAKLQKVKTLSVNCKVEMFYAMFAAQDLLDINMLLNGGPQMLTDPQNMWSSTSLTRQALQKTCKDTEKRSDLCWHSHAEVQTEAVAVQFECWRMCLHTVA